MSQQHWEQYYRTGALATGPMGSDGGYDLEVRQAWVDFFSPLPEAARILDVGTGNGAVALVAAETGAALGRRWEIHATDLAQIDPLRFVPEGSRRLAGIEFHADVATERLPFEAGSFDAVSGQYALEYSEEAAALAEVGRVLKPGGRAQFIVHHADSVLVRNAHESLAQARFVNDEIMIYSRLRRFTTLEGATLEVVRRETEALRDSIRRLKQAVQEAPRESRLILEVALDAVHKLLVARTRMSPADMGKEIDLVSHELQASAQRLIDLVGRAKTAQGLADLEQRASALGFAGAELAPQHHAGAHLVGWRVTLRRA